jgi:NAD(P)-dependent dehydrogenase (short-subunit alcohol dehydrogenase family)
VVVTGANSGLGYEAALALAAAGAHVVAAARNEEKGRVAVTRSRRSYGETRFQQQQDQTRAVPRSRMLTSRFCPCVEIQNGRRFMRFMITA